MDPIINHAYSDQTRSHWSALVVELVGLAGAGKTTIFNELGKRSKSVQLREHPNPRDIKETIFFINYCFSILPTLMQLDQKNGNGLSRREIAWMAILNGWQHTLKHDKQKERKVIVLDQGPIFLMTQLRVFGPGSLRDKKAEKWWQRIYTQWREVVDIVVYLEAPDDCLYARIQSRPDWHTMKGKPEVEVADFLAQYRQEYNRLLTLLSVDQKGPKVMRIDTHKECPDVIVDRLLEIFIPKDANIFN